MAQAITAYLADDGKIHLNKDDADFSDYSGMISTDVSDFLKQQGTIDKDNVLLRVICKWEMWKVGGFDGWLAEQTAIAPSTVAAPLVAKPDAVKALAVHPMPAIKAALQSEYRKRVAVIGLYSAHHRTIEKEFGNEFKLTLYDAHCMHKLDGLALFHKVVVMTKFAEVKAITVLRKMNQEPLLIAGGLDSLREALTNLYLNA